MRRSRTEPEVRRRRARRSTEPTPSEACTRPAIPACPASVASTVVPVWIEPNTTPMSSWATSSTTNAAVTSRAPVTAAARWAWVRRAVGCRANAQPKTSRMLAAMTSASCGAGHDDDQAEQGRAEHERGLVGGALVGERGLHQVRLVVLLLAGDRAPAHPGERPDLRHRRAGDGGRRDDERGVDLGPGPARRGPAGRARRAPTARAPRVAGRRGRRGCRRPGRPRHSPRPGHRPRRRRCRRSRSCRRRGGACPSGPWPAAAGRRRRRRRRGVRRG